MEIRLSKDFADALQRAGGGMSKPTVAIVGRPNVGKSTLFNRILGGRRAIVSERPGTTRDRHFGDAEWQGRRFWLVDTGGLVPESRRFDGPRDPAAGRVRARRVGRGAVPGGRARRACNPVDQAIAERLRKARRPVVLAVNKLDDLERSTAQYEFYQLGFGEPAGRERGGGEGQRRPARRGGRAPAAVRPGRSRRTTINVAVVGRPNVGKSSLVNRLLGEERHVVAPEAGTTRDAIDSPLAVSTVRTSTSLTPQAYVAALK